MASIYAKFIIEIAGKPVENVEKALSMVLKQIEDEKGKFKLVESHVGNPELDEKSTLHCGFLDVEIKFKEFNKIFDFLLDYTPTSIEIIEPSKITFELNDLNTLLNDIGSNTLSAQSQIRNLNAHLHMMNKKIKELENK